MTTFQPDPSADGPPPADAVHPKNSSAQAPTSVARLNDTISGFVRNWGSVWVEGEITSWNARSGHVFGRLKDVSADAHLGFRLWASTRRRVTEELAVGDHVIACLKADYFAKTGDFSFTVSSIRHVGLGDQLERLERLRRALREEGLFDPARKHALPFLPHMIGLITAPGSDAEKDVHRNAELRWPHVRFRTLPVAVQGDRCVPEVVRALEQLDADPDVDVIIVARGGGDPQTLLGFSDERVVRAAAQARTPIVSAIGHENDHPILDDVADVRASTPTDAAKRVVPDVAEQLARVRELRARLTGRLTHRLTDEMHRLEQMRSRPVLRAPHSLLDSRGNEISSLQVRGRMLMDGQLRDHDSRTAQLRSALTALAPGATLARGYAIAQLSDGAIVRDAEQAPAGTALTVTVSRGSIRAVSSHEEVAGDESGHTVPRT